MASDSDPARQAWSLICEVLLGDELHERVHAACAELAMTPALAKALMRLREHEAKPMGALATELGCDASYVTSIVDGLEERGFAERRVLPADRRVRTIALTPGGRKAQQVWLERLHDPPSWLGALDEVEQRQLRDLLHKAIRPDRGASG